MKYLISISGGKDSTACLLWAIDTLPRDQLVPYYIDTKWEHNSVYEYLSYLEQKLEISIHRIDSEGMEALSIRRRMMPNTQMRFCTGDLKIKPAREFFKTIKDDFINIVGIRREESERRANTEVFYMAEGIKTLAPIAYWNTKRVFDFIKEHGVEVNPLYKKGFSRVGCYPCIYARKHEIQMLELEYKNRVRRLEKTMTDLLGKDVTFFPPQSDKHMQPTLNLHDDDHCVNQYGICE